MTLKKRSDADVIEYCRKRVRVLSAELEVHKRMINDAARRMGGVFKPRTDHRHLDDTYWSPIE